MCYRLGCDVDQGLDAAALLRSYIEMVEGDLDEDLQALEEHAKADTEKSICDRIFQFCDLDKDGFLDFAELNGLFVAASGDQLTQEAFQEMCYRLGCDVDQGLDAAALLRSYIEMVEGDLDEDLQALEGRAKATPGPTSATTPEPTPAPTPEPAPTSAPMPPVPTPAPQGSPSSDELPRSSPIALVEPEPLSSSATAAGTAGLPEATAGPVFSSATAAGTPGPEATAGPPQSLGPSAAGRIDETA